MWEDERETKRTAGDVALTEPPAAARLVVILAVPDALPLLVALPEAELELALAPALALALEIAESKGDIIGVGRPWISNVSGLFLLRGGHCRGGILCAMLKMLSTARPGGTVEE